NGLAALAGKIGSDDVALTGALNYQFADPNVGTDRPITVSGGSLSGATAPNYSLSYPTDLKANVTAKNLTITGISIADKEFDGATTATINGTASYVGLQGADNFAVTGTPTAAFLTPDVGANKPVTVSGFTAPSANYTVTQPSGLSANITAILPRTEIRLAAISTGYFVSNKQSNDSSENVDFSSSTGSMGVGSQRSANGDGSNQRAGVGFATFQLSDLFLKALGKPGAKFYVEFKVDGIGSGRGGIPYTDGLDLRFYGVRDNGLGARAYYDSSAVGLDQADIVATTASTGVKKVELAQAQALSQIGAATAGKYVGFGFLNSAGVNLSVSVGNSFAETYSFNVSAAPSDFALVVSLPDTDGDGLADAFETNTGTYVSADNTGTDPTKADTDGDGVSDGSEVAAGTNPLVKNILRFRTIDMLALGKGNFSIPESNLAGGSVTPAGFRYGSATNAAYYGGVPFFITDQANQVWHAAKAPGGGGTGPVSVTFPITVNNVYGFYTLAGLWWGAAGSYVTYTFNFSDGSSYSKTLTNNVDLRDYNI
ncbi:MAG: hypothetical protein EBZ44_06820, partial [Verrucomicrobia bacterium]|nr:hypothetical protein [Verrucomicrobiota bacterium]